MKQKKELDKLRILISKEIKSSFKNKTRPLQEMNQRLEMQEILYEGLIKTYPIKETIKHLLKIGVQKNQISNKVENNTNVIYIEISPMLNVFKEIDKKMEVYGWFFGGGNRNSLANF